MINSYQRRNTRMNLAWTLVLALIYFLFLFPFQVPGLPVGSVMPIIVFFAFCSIYAFKKKTFKKKDLKTTKMVGKYWWWNVFLIVYVWLVLQIFGKGDGNTPFNGYTQMLIILPLFYISGNMFFRNTEDLMRILYLTAIAQSIIIFAAVFSPVLQALLFILIPEGSYNTEYFGGMDMITRSGYHIGLGAFTSAGSLRMAIGQVGACYFLIKSRGHSLFMHLVIFLLIAVATSIVARTGLIVSALGLMSVYYAKRKQGDKRIIGFVVLFFVVISVGFIFITNVFSDVFLGDTFKRLIDTADEGLYDTYFRGYTGEGGNNTIPPISLETLIGLGITYGVSGSGIVTITDGGFMRNYSAMGLIVAIVNYFLLFSIFIKQYKACKSFDNKGLIIYMFLVLLVGEFKEYYIYYVAPICFMFLILNTIEKDERNMNFRIITQR